MPIDPGSDRPVFKQIADDLRRSITSGEYGPGDRLPSESALIERFGVARMTVRSALGILAAEGLTVAEHGRGVFVRQQPPVVRLGTERFSRKLRKAGSGAFASETKRLGRTPRQELIEVGEVEAPKDVADRLGLSEGAAVIVRRRRMCADDVPMQLADSYFPASWARSTELVNTDAGPGGSYARVEETGRRLSRFREELTARAATEPEVRALQLARGVPVFHLVRTAYDEAGEAVEVFDSVVAADKHVFVYDFDAPE